MQKIKKILPIFISAGIIFYIIYYTPPPKSLSDTPILQLISLFGSLLLFLFFLLNLFLKNISRSLLITLGITLLIYLQGIKSLNLLSGGLILLVGIFLLRSLTTRSTENLPTRIPRLTKLKRQ